MLTEDKRPLGQRQKTSLLVATAVARVPRSLWSPLSLSGSAGALDARLLVQWAMSQGMSAERGALLFYGQWQQACFLSGGDSTSFLKVARCTQS